MAEREELIRQAERKCSLELEATRERGDRFAEDCLLEPRQQVEKARLAWEAARKLFPTLPDGPERAKAKMHAEKLEREFRRKLGSLRNEEETRYSIKDKNLASVQAKAKVTDRRALIGSAYFWLG